MYPGDLENVFKTKVLQAPLIMPFNYKIKYASDLQFTDMHLSIYFSLYPILILGNPCRVNLGILKGYACINILMPDHI